MQLWAYEEALEMNQMTPKHGETSAYPDLFISFLITNTEKKIRLAEALASADKAVGLAPENSTVRGIRAFTLDWNANSNFYTNEEVQDFLAQAEQEALVAQQLDPTNPLATRLLCRNPCGPAEMESGRDRHQSGA
jgi:hypothetical protein